MLVAVKLQNKPIIQSYNKLHGSGADLAFFQGGGGGLTQRAILNPRKWCFPGIYWRFSMDISHVHLAAQGGVGGRV